MSLTAPTAAARLDADLASAHTLLGCLVREVAGPDRQLALHDGHLLLRLAHIGARLRARVSRVSTVAMHRFEGPVELLAGGEADRTGPGSARPAWREIGLAELAGLTAAELTARTGIENPEFTAQVLASRDSLSDILNARPPAPQRGTGRAAEAYLDSEQALLGGHPRHPSPKWRSGEPAAWRRFSPETRTAFQLRWLAVPEANTLEHAAAHAGRAGFDEHAATAKLLGGTAVPAGHRAVPVHPWQFELLASDPGLGPVLAQALAEGAIVDLGAVGLPFHPTASVRTLYQPEADVFLKASLNVRLTNCLRKNAAYELSGAVALTALLEEAIAALRTAEPGFGLLFEPAARSVRLPDHLGTAEQRLAILEGFGSIVRTGLRAAAPGSAEIHLMGSLVASGTAEGARARLADIAPASPDGRAAWAADWWDRYVRLLVPPVLRLWAEHGVVLEPHLQNVLAVLDAHGLPESVLARDLEGTKLLDSQHAQTLAGLPAEVAAGAAYDEERAWNRVAYCLFVNNLAETAGALADLVPHLEGFEDTLWVSLADTVARVSGQLGQPARLRALLSGVPLPAKTNMLIRWQRAADRHAGYVPFPNPLGAVLPADATTTEAPR
ncbi:IucA/IucC family protein [Sinomonas sp. B1-1]|uniref:IucA/IucC family protein n=1 Tax=Sinomonas sp. B1-1 TaxID=3141454 RepID=UPI003D2E8DA1